MDCKIDTDVSYKIIWLFVRGTLQVALVFKNPVKIKEIKKSDY